MSVDDTVEKPEAVDDALQDMKLEEEDLTLRPSPLDSSMANNELEAPPTPQAPQLSRSGSPDSSQTSQLKVRSATQTPKSEEYGSGDIISGEVTVKEENGKPKLSRKASQKVISRPAPLFDHLPNSTEEASSEFQVIRDCIYGSKYMGSSEHDALGCDCSAEFRKSSPISYSACDFIPGVLTIMFRRWQKSSLWRGIRLHQSSDKNGMYR